MINREIRVRFAPSPTGPLHIGGVRTALYNYLFARKNQGKLILRIEDTDLSRFVPGAESYIIESLRWCGIIFDEGIKEGGPFGPYRQSERKEMYHQFALQLLNTGNAYYAFDTEQELQEKRDLLKQNDGNTFQYDAVTRMQMKNSLTLPADAVKQKLSAGEHFVIRLKVPENEEVRFHDLIRGDIVVQTKNIDDKVLFKSDGMPTYHLANIVDDHLMEITHVIRGEEWLPSAPLHVLLYRFLGWEMPAFSHLPLILKPDGNGKLSKRDGDRLGFPVFPLEWKDPATGEKSSGYRESGYLPDAFINMLALLGWNPGTTQEVLSMDELIDQFSLDRVHKSGSKFDPEKAKWFNQHYLHNLPLEELAELFEPVLLEKKIDFHWDYVLSVCGAIRERITFLGDLWKESWFFFEAPTTYDEAVVRKKWLPETPGILKDVLDELEKTDSFSSAHIENTIKSYLTAKGLQMGQVMNALRLCVIGSNAGPGMFDVAEILGKEAFLSRIRKALDIIKII